MPIRLRDRGPHGTRTVSTLAAPTPGGVPPYAPIGRKGSKPVAVIRVSRLWGSSPRAASATAARLVSEPDGLDAFGSESGPVTPKPQSDGGSGSSPNSGGQADSVHVVAGLKWLVLFLVIAALAGAATWEYQRWFASPTPGSLTIQTTTPGLEVTVAGASAGRTPLTMSLAPGSYRVQVGTAGQQRDLDVTIAAGATVQHFLDVPASSPAAAAVSLGSLQVQTDVPSMTVLVDGAERGHSPLTITDLTPGEHQVLVRADQRSVRRTVSVKAGETLSLVISSIAPAAASPGWLAVSAPVVMQLRENGQLIGTTEAEKLMLAAGDHDIEIINDALGFKVSRRITVAPGKVASTAVELPHGVLSINALPWAEVWLDGERVGETPIANLNTRLGQHEVVFRHPQLGEKRETVLVTLRQPARLGVDLRRQ